MFANTKPWATLALLIGLFTTPLWAHTLTVQIEPPGTAGLVIDRADSYLSESTLAPEARAYFGGWDGWGQAQVAPASLTFKTLSALPSTLHVVWLDGDDDQFWGGHMAVPRQALMQLIRRHPDEGFNRLIVSLADKGRLTLWLGSDRHEVQLGEEWQADKVNKDWAAFVPALPPARQGQTRAEYVRIEKNRRINPYNDELFVFTADKDPVAHYPYWIARDDGLTYCGRSNDRGETRRINTGTATSHLSLYGGTCPLLDEAADDIGGLGLISDVVGGVRRMLPY